MAETKTKRREKRKAYGMSGISRVPLSDGAQKKTKICPKCGKRKALEHFGLRNMAGKLYPQARCRACRSNTKFRKEAKPRGVEYEFVAVEDGLDDASLEVEETILPDQVIESKYEPTPAVLLADDPEVITQNNVLDLYLKYYPNDKQQRGWRVKAKRLSTKLGIPIETSQGGCPV